MSEHIVFYVGTQNFYHMMTLSLKSLLYHTHVDKVYFMIETDTFPEPLPPCVECVNISGNTYFRHDGPNYHSCFSYIVMIRAALPLMFPHIHTALSIDADTLIQNDISPLFDVDLSGQHIAACYELPQHNGYNYYNAGVMLMNFDQLRTDDVPRQAINALNTYRFRYPEQDVLNNYCKNRFVTLPSDYNYVPGITYPSEHPRIRHYVAKKGKPLMLRDAKPYENMSWEDVLGKKGDRNE